MNICVFWPKNPKPDVRKINLKKMKKIIYIFALVAIALTSCDKNENMKSKIHIEEIKQNAKSISLSHDSLVLEMLKVEKHKIINKKKKINN